MKAPAAAVERRLRCDTPAESSAETGCLVAAHECSDAAAARTRTVGPPTKAKVVPGSSTAAKTSKEGNVLKFIFSELDLSSGWHDAMKDETNSCGPCTTTR